MMGTLLISQGTPMLLMGDEVGRSQGGNNNAYCQDNAMNWLKLEGLEPRDAAFLDFTRRLIALRRSRPLLRHPSFLHKAAVGEEPVEVRWLRPDGEEMEPDDWHNPAARTLGLLIRNKPALLALFNSHFEEVPFSLPVRGRGWGLLLDTAAGRVPERPVPQRAAGFVVPPRTLLVLEETE